MADSNQNLTDEQKRIQRLRAKVAAREAVGKRDSVTDPVILAQIEKERLANYIAREEGTTPIPAVSTSSTSDNTTTDTSTTASNQNLTPDLLKVGENLKKAGVTLENKTFGESLKLLESLEGGRILDTVIPDFNNTEDQQKLMDRFIRSNTPCSDGTGGSDSLSVGLKVVVPDPCKDTTLDKQKAHISNFFDKVTGPNKDLVNLPQEIKNISSAVSNDMAGYVNKMSGSLNDELEILFSGGFGKLSAEIFAQVSKSFPYSAALNKIVDIQEGLIPPISSLLNNIFCVNTKIEAALPGIVEDLLTAAIDNVIAVPACVVDEIVGAIDNKVINMIDSIATPGLGPILKVLNIAFNVKDFLLGGVDLHKKIGGLSFNLKCPEEKGPKCPVSSVYTVGKGVQKGSTLKETITDFDQVIKGTALSQAVKGAKNDFEEAYGVWQVFGSKLADVKVGVKECVTTPPRCSLPKVEIFGGGGVDAVGKVILGKFIDRFDSNDVLAGVRKTASIVGIEIQNPGSGFTDDPLITIQDNCNQGYGAYAKVHVDHNPQSPTYGEISSITMLSTGTNYPAEDEETPLYIDKVIIEDPGKGYADDDTLEDFDLEIRDGKVVGGQLRNWVSYDDLPELNINSETGVGAILRPVMSKTRPQGKVVEVIDCVGRR